VERLEEPVLYGRDNGHGGGRVADPVFVLCVGRPGSTLLRLVLDSHPVLACPPETNIPALCSQLAVVWSLIKGAPAVAAAGGGGRAAGDPGGRDRRGESQNRS
jgi:hypothetical protein